MPVPRNARNYPLVLKSDPLNVALVAAYDWAAEDGSTTKANGKDHVGSFNWTVPATTPTIVTTANGKGRDTSVGATLNNNSYSANDVTSIGLGVGTGDFTIWRRLRMPSTAPVGVEIHDVMRFGTHFIISVYELPGDGGYRWYISGNLNSSNSPVYAPNAFADIYITRIAGTVSYYIDGVFKGSATGNTWNFVSTVPGGGTCNMGQYSNGSPPRNFVFMDSANWTRGLSAAEITAHYANPYNYYENSAVADSITVSSPSAGATVPTSIAISGVYAGGTTITSIEASFNGGAYATIVASPTGGTFSGTLSGQNPANGGTLTVRTKNGATTVATTTVTNLNVVANSISFTPWTNAATWATPYRMYQRNGSNQATVQIKGTYIGTPTTIEYRWGTGTWQTLVASPTGGAFDTTVVLQGLDQKDLSIRFSNSTGITATLPSIGVGLVFMVLGQSNHEGFATTGYVAPVAPGAHPTWISATFDKANHWRAHTETFAERWDSIPSGDATPYPAAYTSLNGKASYFGILATKLMAEGYPCAFVPCALASHGLETWQPGQPLYSAAVARATLAGGHEAALMWDGEDNVISGTTRAQAETLITNFVNGWSGAFPGKKTVILNLGLGCGTPGQGAAAGSTGVDAIRAAFTAVAAANTNISAVADLAVQYAGLHFEGVPEMTAISNTVYNALNSAYQYSDAIPPTMVGSMSASPVTNSSITWNWSAATDNVGVAGYEFKLDSGAYVDIGNATSKLTGGLADGSSHTGMVRAYDAKGNYATPISLTVSTLTYATTVNFSMVDAANAAAAATLDYSFYQQPRINTGTPIKSGSVVVSAGAGSFSIAGLTTLAPGGIGFLTLSLPDGTFVAAGQVAVA